MWGFFWKVLFSRTWYRAVSHVRILRMWVTAQRKFRVMMGHFIWITSNFLFTIRRYYPIELKISTEYTVFIGHFYSRLKFLKQCIQHFILSIIWKKIMTKCKKWVYKINKHTDLIEYIRMFLRETDDHFSEIT